LTYEELSDMTGISMDTLKSIASRKVYNTSLQNITDISNALHINPIEYLHWSTNDE
jgi:DNA-binding Xre family transcriptional regulator